MTKYYPGLNFLRAIAALIVVVGHIDQSFGYKNIPGLASKFDILLPDTHTAVVLFFVLSGFLISNLLVVELKLNGKIAYSKFYMRRILRIFPLYYLILISSYLLFDGEWSIVSILLCATIFPNIAMAQGIIWPYSRHLWSIGVEEQFYLFWPLALSRIRPDRMVLFILLFFISYSLFPIIFGFFYIRFNNPDEFLELVYSFFWYSKFNSMAFGSLLGYIYTTKHSFFKYLCNNYAGYISFFFSFFLWFSGVTFKYFTYEVYTIFFGIMILNVAVNTNLKIPLENKFTKFLGSISFGIYMYHFIIIYFFLPFLIEHLEANTLSFYVICYSSIISLSIFVAWVSFVSYEKYFLSFKKYFYSHPISPSEN